MSSESIEARALVPVAQADRDNLADAFDDSGVTGYARHIRSGTAEGVNGWSWARPSLIAIARHRLAFATRTDPAQVEALRNVRPDIDAATPEPSLDTIVFAYYDAHFDGATARQHTDAYFAALSTQPATTGPSAEYLRGRSEALEDAAKVAEERFRASGWNAFAKNAASEIATIIRALQPICMEKADG